MQGGRSLLCTGRFIDFSLAAQAVEGNADAARDKISMCVGCHEFRATRRPFPMFTMFPKLGGQHPAYIIKALEQYRGASAAIRACGLSRRA